MILAEEFQMMLFTGMSKNQEYEGFLFLKTDPKAITFTPDNQNWQ